MRSAAALSHGGAFAFAGCRGAVLRLCRLPRRHAARPRRDARKGGAHGRGQRRTRPWTTLHTAMGNVAHGHGQRRTRPRATRGAGGKNEKVGVFLFLKTGCQRVAYRSTKKGDLSNIFTAWVGLTRPCAGLFGYFTQEPAVAGWLWQWPDICGKVTELHRVQDG